MRTVISQSVVLPGSGRKSLRDVYRSRKACGDHWCAGRDQRRAGFAIPNRKAQGCAHAKWFRFVGGEESAFPARPRLHPAHGGWYERMGAEGRTFMSAEEATAALRAAPRMRRHGRPFGRPAQSPDQSWAGRADHYRVQSYARKCDAAQRI